MAILHTVIAYGSIPIYGMGVMLILIRTRTRRGYLYVMCY